MNRSRLPATLQSNRGDIKDLNDRANLIKIINDRNNALKKRKELMVEYNEIMKRLHKSQKKKAARLKSGRGGVRTSRSREIRQQERYKRGERRREGEEEAEIIGEEVKKGPDGQLQITYRNYDDEERIRQRNQIEKDAEQLRIEARQDFLRLEDRQDREQIRMEAEVQRALDIDRLTTIRAEDLQLRYDEKERDRQDRLLRDREDFSIRREFRDRDDQFRDIQINREDERAAYNRAIDARKLDYAETAMGRGLEFQQALFSLDDRINRRFDAAEQQFRNLLLTNPNGVEIENLQTERKTIQLPDRPRSQEDTALDELESQLSELEEQDEILIPTQETPEITQQITPIRPTRPPGEEARAYALDLPPNKELRQPRGDKRTLQEDLDIISQYIDVPKQGTPERIDFDNKLTAGEFQDFFNLDRESRGLPTQPSGASSTGSVAFSELTSNPDLFSPDELAEEIQDVSQIRKSMEADLLSAARLKAQIERLKGQVEVDKKSKLDQSYDKLRQIEQPASEEGWASIDIDNPLDTQLKLDKQKFLDTLTPGQQFVDVEGDNIGFLNPLNNPEEDRIVLQTAAEAGQFLIGSQSAADKGILQSQSPDFQLTSSSSEDEPSPEEPNIDELPFAFQEYVNTIPEPQQPDWLKEYVEGRPSPPRPSRSQILALDEMKADIEKAQFESQFEATPPPEFIPPTLEQETIDYHNQNRELHGLSPVERIDEVPQEIREYIAGGLEQSGIPAVEQPQLSKTKFVPGKYTKEQEVMYYRDNNWRPAKIVEHKSDDAGEAQLTIQRTSGTKTQRNTPVETEYSRVIPKPNDGERLKQFALREELKDGVMTKELKPGKKRLTKSADWEDRDKFIIHNQTDFEFMSIPPRGRSLLNYHKEDPHNYRENTYFHTVLNDDDSWNDKRRVIGPKALEPGLENGLIRLEKLNEKFPFKKAQTTQEPEPDEGPGVLSQVAGGVGSVAAGVGGAALGLAGGLAGGIAAQLPTPYEAGAAIGGGVASAGGALIGGAVGLVGAALGGGEQPESEDSGNILI